MKSQVLYFSSRHFSGTKTALRWWRNAQNTESPARGFVWILHGIGEHSQRYNEVASYLTQFGLDVLALDWPGHGLSASQGQQNQICSLPTMLGELKNTFNAWNTEGPLKSQNAHLKPWYLFGHSMGALLALMWILKGKEPGDQGDFALRAYVSGPPLKLRMPVPTWKAKLSQVSAQMLPNLKIPSGIDPYGLSYDLVNVEGYKQDKDVHGMVTPSWYESLVQAGAEVLAKPHDIEIPLCIAIGDDDPISDPQTTLQYFENLNTQKKLLLNSHKKHEIFNEYERKDLYESLVAWFL